MSREAKRSPNATIPPTRGVPVTTSDVDRIEVTQGLFVGGEGDLTVELREQIKASSPHLQLIARRTVERIRARYSIDDELFMARMAGGISTGLYEPSASELAEVAEYGAYVEGVRTWARGERAKLGL